MATSLSLLYILYIVSIRAANYQCIEGEDCNALFNTNQSTGDMTIHCPSNYECHITCTGPTPPASSDSHHSCRNATVMASLSSKITIHCNGLENCQHLKFIGSNSNTTIHCNGTNACQLAQFDFNSAPYVAVYCTSDGSCNSADFNATYTEEIAIHFNTIHAGDETDIYCGAICSISTANTQSNVMIYSHDSIQGDLLQCDTNENCLIDSSINCDTNYSIICDIEYADNTYTCDECLNVLFTSYVTDIILDYTTTHANSLQYRQRTQYIIHSTIIQLLTDPTDQFLKPIQTTCDCIADIDTHVAILITKQLTPTQRRRLLQSTYSMAVTITTDIEIIHTQMQSLVTDERFKSLLAVNMAPYDDAFEIHSVRITNADTDTVPNAQVIWWVTAIVGGILGVILMIAIIGTIQMYKYDVTIYVTGILLYGLYTADFYSDILFAYEVAITYLNTRDILIGALFIGCLVFLVLPIVASIVSLFRFQDKWKKDISIGDRVTGWNRDWSTYLLFLTIFSGSSFAAVNMFNSRVFGHPLFCMGLSYRHIKKFENQRLWGVILSENIPQLAIQGLFVWRKQNVLSVILILAFASSLLSVIVALIDIYNNKRLFGKNAERYDYQTVLKVPVISHEVGLKQWKLCLATHRFNEVFSKIIGVDKYAIEVDLPSPHPNGLVIIFSVRSVNITPKQIMEAMTRAQKNGAMAKFIGEAWHLEKDPLLGSIKVDQIGRKTDDLTEHEDVPVEEVNPLNSDAKTLEEQNAVNAVMIDPKRWDLDRTDAVDAKPYDPLDTATRAKLAHMKKTKSQSEAQQNNNDTHFNVNSTPKPLSEGEETDETNDDMYTTENNGVPTQGGDIPEVEPEGHDNNNNNNNNDNIKSAAVGDSDIPQNISETQKQLKKQSQSELPRQKTGTHTKKMIQMIQTGAVNSDFVAKGGSMHTRVSTQPMSASGQRNKVIIDHVNQYRPQAQQYGNAIKQNPPPNMYRKHSQSTGAVNIMNNPNGNNPYQNYAQSSTNLNMNRNQNNYAQSSTNFNIGNHHHNNQFNAPQGMNRMNQNMAHPHHHGHAQTYHQVPYNYQQTHQQPLPEQPQVRYPPSGGMDLTAQFQQHARQMQQQGGYAASAFNLGRNHYNNTQQPHYPQNAVRQFQQNPQMYSASTTNMNEEPVVLRKITDHEHESFVPPAPQQEVHKYVAWKTKRQTMDEEKRLRQKQAKDQRRLEKEPNLNKIASMNETDVNRPQWSEINAKNVAFQGNVTNANYHNAAFANNLVHHGQDESNHMDEILYEMDAAPNQF